MIFPTTPRKADAAPITSFTLFRFSNAFASAPALLFNAPSSASSGGFVRERDHCIRVALSSIRESFELNDTACGSASRDKEQEKHDS
jgi:hypothetical protein